MIADPLNDEACLGLVTDEALESVDTESVRELAMRFRTTKALASWIRRLPQKSDVGRVTDGPKVDCDVPQRLRLPADDPNCVERSALYLAVAENLDPETVRSLATIATPLGRHTFVVEDDVPVNLDPRVPRNALDAGLFKLAGGTAEDFEPQEVLGWVLGLADEPAASLIGGKARLRNAENAVTALMEGHELPANAANDLGFALAMAESEAGLYGDEAYDAIEVSDRALRRLLTRPRNAFGIRIGGATIRPNWDVFGSLGKVGGKLAMKVGAEYVKSQLGLLGLAPGVIGALEKELKAEGVTLGALAEPPPRKGTLAALTTSALLRRRLLR